MSPKVSRQDAAAAVWRQMLECTMAQIKNAMPALSEIGLTPGHMKLMMSLEADQARPMGWLANQFGCDASTMTWLVDRLEEQQLAERRSLPEDRRVKAVALTKQGHALRERLQRELYKAPPEICALDTQTLEQLRELFEKINANGQAS